MVFLKTKNPVGQHRANPVLAVFVKRPQAELKSARLAFQRAADDTEGAAKSQSGSPRRQTVRPISGVASQSS